MKKNPFSLFDFLGYVFPGAFALFLLYFFINCEEIEGINSIVKSFSTMNIPFTLENTLLWTLFSYILGHLIAYLSSLTIEQFAIWLYGYPSDFLLRDVKPLHYWSYQVSITKLWKRYNIVCFIFHIIKTYFWRIIVGFIVLPLTICSLFFGKFLGLKKFFIKRLDDDLIFTIKSRCFALAKYLGYKVSGKETDFNRVIYHYEYELQKSHATKMDNYVALYGFLRAITFIFNCLFLYLLFFIVVPSLILSTEINRSLLCFLGIVAIISYLFFMGYMKFNRRFTLESFMCLIIDTSYLKIPKELSDITSTKNKR